MFKGIIITIHKETVLQNLYKFFKIKEKVQKGFNKCAKSVTRQLEII